MSITGIRELLSRSDASGSKSTILKPLTWFLALIIGGILTLLKFGSPIWLTIEEFYKLKYCSTVVYMVPRA